MLYQIRRNFAKHNPSAFLLVAQLVFLVLYAIFDGLHRPWALLSALNILVVVIVVWVVNRSPVIHRSEWILAIPTLTLLLVSVWVQNPNMIFWASLLGTVLYFLAAGALITYMLGNNRVTTDELFAIAATFTLLAWGFTYAYEACQIWAPGSFISSINPDPMLTFTELLSLSFTNLTATGLSDVLPTTTGARVLVMIEQFGGIGYVAMVVSRLIGMTINQRVRK